MRILEEKEKFQIEVTKEVSGLDFTKVGTRYTAFATFIGRNNRECVVTEPQFEGDKNTGSHWIHSDNYTRLL